MDADREAKPNYQADRALTPGLSLDRPNTQAGRVKPEWAVRYLVRSILKVTKRDLM